MRKPNKIPITRPTLRPFSSYARHFKRSINSGLLTTNAYVKEFEEKLAKRLGVRNVVAVSSCTAGLMLVMRGLGLTGEVIMPSFTFSASGLPLAWNGLTPVFADIDLATFTVDPKAVEKLISPRTSAIFATHVFGVPCNIDALTRIAKKHKLKLIFDAAHAFGSTYKGKPIGSFGDAEVFSTSPTKVLTTGEGGIVATNNDTLAAYVRKGRNYGDDGTEAIPHAGLSARMSEFHAAIGIISLSDLTKNLKRRLDQAAHLKRQLHALEPRLKFQTIPPDTKTTYKDFSIYVDPAILGYTRDDLQTFFDSRGIVTRKYFFPPLHRHATYQHARKGSLTITTIVAENVLSLPLYSHISRTDINRIIREFKTFVHDRKKS